LIVPLLLSIPLHVVPVKDTVWWNTAGGTVTEHRDENGANCALTFQSDAGSVVFEWQNAGGTSVTAIDWTWELPAGWRMPVAMQIGDIWLSNGGNSAIIEGVAHGNTVQFPISQPVDELLRPAEQIQVQIKGSTLSVPINRSKLATLLDRAKQCRDGISHIGGQG
jgi:hypothetical protein